MDTGLDDVMENEDYPQKLVAALDTDDIAVKQQAFELLSALCVYRPDGYVRALETLQHSKELKKRRHRFQLVVDELRTSDAAEYSTALLAFVNCLIIAPASLSERVRIRNEFMGLKILEVLNCFRAQWGSHPELSVQLDVFDEQRATDEAQFSGPDLSSHVDVFFAILAQVSDTPQELPFLSILQHLLRPAPLSEVIWETAETLVHRATLLESKQEADRLLRASNLRCHCSCHYRQVPATPCDLISSPPPWNSRASESQQVQWDPTTATKECSSEAFPQVPPPPPPPPPGCPPPPPRPLPQTDTPKPKTKMKSFNWSKIPASRVVGRDNLWSRIARDHTGSPNDLDFEAMETLFCQHAAPRSGDSSDKRKKEVQEINLLDGKRSLNINIFLKQFRSSTDRIVRILEEGAHEELGAERLRGLLKILPEADEVDLLKNFDGDPTRLGSAEKFLLQLIEVPSFKLRVESLLLKEEFLANQEFLENSIETIRAAAKEIEKCGKLHEILYRVLVAGNFLNAGGYAGNAAGFKMLSLLKMTDIRANKPSVTLVHYVAEEVFKKRPELLDFTEEIRNLEEASKISIETLKSDVSSLCERVSKVSAQVATADDQIKLQMQDFIEFARSKMSGIQAAVDGLEGDRLRLSDFLCEDSNAFKLEDCCRVFHSFCVRFKSAVQENERRRKQELLAEARRKQREQQMALKRRSLELPGADHLMDDIRSGFPERLLEERLKRHSDPLTLEKSNDLDDRLATFKSRRAKFLDGTTDGELERVRRSGRRKKVESRERSGSSPPPLEGQEPEVDSKQKLRSKINDWMLQNDKEQKRERDLQMKMLQERKKRPSNGDSSGLEKNIIEEIEETDPNHVAFKQNPRSVLLKNDSFSEATKCASPRRSESFTQKIIELIDATPNESKPFVKTRLYSSNRESGASQAYARQASLLEDQSVTNSFDRFAPTRKTQRRLKLREMRIEAENIKAVRQEPTPDSSVQTDSSLVQNGVDNLRGDSKSDASEINGSSVSHKAEMDLRNGSSVGKCADGQNVIEVNEEATFTRQKNTSLRSRQSRLARRINSLSTPVTSSAEEQKSEQQPGKRADRPNHEVPKHISHKVTVSTETKSKVTITKPMTSKPRQAATSSIPAVVKTTRNVKVQQTTADVNKKRVQTQSSLTQSRSPCTNVKNGKTERTGVNKITIQHNGSVKFTKSNASSKKAGSSASKTEKNVTTKRPFL